MSAVSEPARNDIPNYQNTEPFLKLLRSRSHIYQVAVWFQWAQLMATVPTALVGAFLSILYPDLRAIIALVIAVSTALDVFIFDRAMKRRLKEAAKVSEQFDCELLGMQWNSFVAGKRVDPQILQEAAISWKAGDGNLLNWYSPAVAAVSAAEARIICQRANLSYDSALRRIYGKWLISILAIIIALVVLTSIMKGLSWVDITSTIALPLAPLILWSVREFLRQKDSADSIDQIKGEADSFLEKLYAGQIANSDQSLRSREFQDAIFLRRSQNPLVFPFIYKLNRRRLEIGMSNSTDEIIRRLKQRDQAIASSARY